MFSFLSRSRISGMIFSPSRSRIFGIFFLIPFPFPNFGNVFFRSLPVPKNWDRNCPFPFPFSNSQKLFPLTTTLCLSAILRQAFFYTCATPFIGLPQWFSSSGSTKHLIYRFLSQAGPTIVFPSSSEVS